MVEYCGCVSVHNGKPVVLSAKYDLTFSLGYCYKTSTGSYVVLSTRLLTYE